MKKILFCFLTALLFLFPLVSCEKNTEKTVVRLNEVTHSVFYAPLYYAINAGYFEKEGLEIELTNGGGADKSMTAILSGSADVGFMGPESAIYVYQQGKTDFPVVFGQLTKRDGSFLVSRKNEPHFKWEDLAGKYVIAGRRGGVPAMTFAYVCNQHGLRDGENVTLDMDVAFNLMAGAFEGGLGDYCTMFEPTASEFQAAGKGYIVASVGKESGEIPYTCFIAKKSYLENNPETVKRFLRAVYAALRDVKTLPAEKIAEVIAPSFAGTALSSLAVAVKSYVDIDAWCYDMTMTEDAFLRLQTVMKNAGELSEYAPYDKLTSLSAASGLYAEFFPENP